MALALCIAVMVAALFLGGGTRSGFLSDVLLQLIAIPLLVFAVWRYGDVPKERRAIWVVIAIAAVVAVPILQLLPLPEIVWRALPARSLLTDGFDLAGQSHGMMPLSLTSRDTWLAGLSLIPPIAMLLGVLLLTYPQRRILSLMVVGVGVASAVVGLLQVAQGQESPLRFYEVTNTLDTVGFFANRNHFAALNYSVLVLLGAWVISVTTTMSAENSGSLRKSRDSAWILYLMVGLTAFAILISTQAMARSRAGLGLMLVAIALVVALGVSARASGSRLKSIRFLVGAFGFGLLLTLQYALFGILERFVADPMQDYRIRFVRNTTDAALAYLPWGSGVGSFTSIYPMFEKAADLTLGTFANRAHNDIVELWLEAGVFGLAILVVLSIGLAWRGVRLWSSPQSSGQLIDGLLANGAVVVLALLLAHSFVDYPLRTGAIMVLAAFSCGMVLPPLVPPAQKVVEASIKTQRATKSSARAREPVDILSGQASSNESGAASFAWPMSSAAGTPAASPTDLGVPPAPVAQSKSPMAWPSASPFYIAEPVIEQPGDDPSMHKWPKEWKRPVN